MQARFILGVLFIALGAMFLLHTTLDLGGPWFLDALSVVFLILYFASGSYGFLIPGGILAGVAIGLHLQGLADGLFSSGLFLLSLGCGFLLIFAIDRIRRKTPAWPLIPGGILAGFGLYICARAADWFPPELLEEITRYWPLILIALGVFLILKRRS